MTKNSKIVPAKKQNNSSKASKVSAKSVKVQAKQAKKPQPKQTKKSSPVKILTCSQAPPAVGPYSVATQVPANSSFVFLSGALGLNTKGEFAGTTVTSQADQILKNVDAILTENGLTKENVAKCTVFLIDMKDFAAVNEIYTSYFGTHKPARTCFSVVGLPRGGLVEIEVLAVK